MRILCGLTRADRHRCPTHSPAGISPDPLKERQHYCLGGLRDPRINWAILDTVLGPDAVETDFADRVASRMLFFANGFKLKGMGEPGAPGQPDAEPTFGAELIPAIPEARAHDMLS